MTARTTGQHISVGGRIARISLVPAGWRVWVEHPDGTIDEDWFDWVTVDEDDAREQYAELVAELRALGESR